MFGTIVPKYAPKPKNIWERAVNRVRILRKYAAVEIDETTVCGMLIYRATVTLPYGIDDLKAISAFRKASRELYGAGIKRAAVGADFPFVDALKQAGILKADTSAMYASMYFPMVQKLSNIMDIDTTESHILIYTHTLTKEVSAFCEKVAKIFRYVTVIGTKVAEEMQARLFSEYGIAGQPPFADGSYKGDILVCFDEPNGQYAPSISVQGALCVENGDAVQPIKSFQYVNSALFTSHKYEPYATGDERIDSEIMSFLLSGGFLKSREIHVDKLIWNGMKIHEKC